MLFAAFFAFVKIVQLQYFSSNLISINMFLSITEINGTNYAFN